MPNWTINGGDFTNDTFAEAGISRVRYTLQNGGQDTASFFLAAGDASADAPVAEKDDVILTYDSVVRFRGFVRSVKAVASGRGEGYLVELEGAMMKLARTPLLQQIAVAGETAEEDGTGYSADVTLGYDDEGARMNLAETITDLLLSTAGRHGLTTGTIMASHDVTAPLMEMADATVWTALQRVLAWLPDCVVWFDHAAGTVNVTKPANLAGVSIAGSGNTSGVLLIEKDRKRRLSVNGVIINWKTTATVDGVDKVSITTDSAGTITGMDVPVVTIPLMGQNVDILSQEVKAATIPRGVEDFDQATWAAWIKAHIPELSGWDVDTYPDALVIMECEQTVDEDNKTGLGTVPVYGEEELPAYPRMLLGGAVPEWQSGISAAPVKLRIKVRPGEEYADAPGVKAIFGQEEEYTKSFTLDCTGTDAQSITYTTPVIHNDAEEPITGLAADWYAALNAVAPSFQIELAGDEARMDIYPGKKLSLTGTFAVSNAVVQAVTVDIEEGRTVITTGPQSRLTPADLEELMRAGTRRSPLNSRSGSHRTDATPSGRTFKGAAAAAVKNNGAATPAPSRPMFTAFLAEPGVVKVTSGAVIHNKPRGLDYWDTFTHKIDGNRTWTDEAVLDEIEPGDFIWVKITRGQSTGAVFTQPISGAAPEQEFCQDVWVFSTAEVQHGPSYATPQPPEEESGDPDVPDVDIWPLAQYLKTGDVESVVVLASGWPIYCPFLVWSYRSVSE